MSKRRIEPDGSFIDDDEVKTVDDHPKKINAGKESHVQGGGWSPAEEQAVSEINKILKREDRCHRQVGEQVDKAVEERGGNGYGDKTIENLARHPSLNCSREHLRRCWHYFMLIRDHGESILEVAPTRRYSHLYQISRLYQCGDEEEQAEAILGMAKKAEDEGLTVAALRQAVTTHLKSLSRCKPRKPKPPDKDKDPEGDGGDPYSAFPEIVGTLVYAVDRIAERPLELQTHAAEMFRKASALGMVYAKLVSLIAEVGEWYNVSPSVKAVVRDLQRLCDRCDAEADSSKEAA